ncbi:hypothetical protein DK842_13615 [Chromobacterium phragmitis]|nr:hypothetical protein DK842_13615 [Chromobacterium phragmitis]
MRFACCAACRGRFRIADMKNAFAFLACSFLVSGCADLQQHATKIADETLRAMNAQSSPSAQTSTSSGRAETPAASVSLGMDLRPILTCQSKGYDLDALRRNLKRSPAVSRSFVTRDEESIYVLRPGVSINGLPVSYIAVWGIMNSGTGSSVVAMTDRSVAAVGKAMKMKNQKPRSGYFTFVKNMKLDFAGGKRLTQFGCVLASLDEE